MRLGHGKNMVPDSPASDERNVNVLTPLNGGTSGAQGEGIAIYRAPKGTVSCLVKIESLEKKCRVGNWRRGRLRIGRSATL